VISYDLRVTTTAQRSALRDRLYQAYASQHAGCGDGMAAALAYRRDIRPVLPLPSAGPVIDIGCGQGELVRLLLADGYNAEGVDVSPEQVAVAQAAGLCRVRHGDYRDLLLQRQGQLAAVTATDVLEHLTKDEVLDTFDHIIGALRPGGVFVARVPNAVSPLGGHVRYGDFTHESSFTARSVRQLAAAAGFCSVKVQPCPPVAHGLISAARAVAWKPVSGLLKIALAAETGVLRGHLVTQNLSFAAYKAG
jgi:2-polyprenyl-3-methyl-5-hydroxy-6-metoxy-1,4-benzoquinol methylase